MGEKVALANIQDSTGLAKALDEAAGSSTTGNEDTDLYGAIQTEYEKYFRLCCAVKNFSRIPRATHLFKIIGLTLNDIYREKNGEEKPYIPVIDTLDSCFFL